jgi:hypothetical protein
MDSLDKRPKRRNVDIRYGLRNISSFYRAGSLMTVSRELARYKLLSVGYRRSDGREVAPNLQEDTHFSTEREMKIMN